MKRILLALVVAGAFASESQACFLRMFTCGPSPVRVLPPQHKTIYQAPPPQITVVNGKLVLPSPESLGIDPRPVQQTSGYDVLPQCPNGNCPR
jgi:hypothetical protein